MRLLLCFLFVLSLAAQPREVAITIDDLPRGGDDPAAFHYDAIRAMTEKLLKPLAGTHAIGFVNPGRDSATAIGDDGLQRILRLWREAGLDLGNHTQTHPNINKTALADYQADVLAAEPAITKARGARSVYFRHPFLFTGPDAATRAALSRFLDEQRYVVAPVTVDNSDWLFAAVYAAAANGGDIPQILLIHANQLNADAMPDLLALMRRRGYRFIPVEQALRHPAYRLADGYTGPWGISWIRRWAAAKGIRLTGEPNEPKEILDAFQASRGGGSLKKNP